MGEEVRDQVIMVRLNRDATKTLDPWVESGLVKTRSEAAALFVREGLKVRTRKLGQLKDAIEEVKRAKAGLKKKAREILGPPDSCLTSLPASSYSVLCVTKYFELEELMMESDLRRLERLTFRAAADSGLWDIFLASIVALFAIAPLLSGILGDFWSSAVFVPVWAAGYGMIRLVEARVVRRRLGVVEFARPRRKRLLQLSVIMVVVNLIALILGIAASAQDAAGQAFLATRFFPLMLLVVFSLCAFFLEIPRLFFYGVLLATAPFVGEMLFTRGYVAHHGFPVVFGVSATAILASGIVRFVHFLPQRQGALEEPSLEENRG